MEENKQAESKVEFSDNKSDGSKAKLSYRKTKIAVISTITIALLLGVVVSLSAYFALRQTTPTRLAEINLEEGETLTYKVDQHIEIQGGDVQKATISAIVGIRVLNKTSEEYWFLMKFDLSYVNGNVDLKGINIMTDYFLVRLQLNARSRAPNRANNGSGETFEVYGKHFTNEYQVRLVFGILEQLLPTVQRDLYEDVDGEKGAGAKPLDPEMSPLLPGSVKMHREANTSDKESILIKNHFDSSDFVTMSSEIDLDMKYSDFAFINKSNGMVTESRSFFSEQLDFGDFIDNKGGLNANKMKMTLKSHVSLTETNYFGYAESETVNFHLFVKLVVLKTKASVSVKEEPAEEIPLASASNSRQTPSNVSLFHEQNNSTNSSITPLKRSRRVPFYSIREIWRKSDPLYLSVSYGLNLFEKKVIGIKLSGDMAFALKDTTGGVQVDVTVKLSIGNVWSTNFIDETYKDVLKNGNRIRSGHEWKQGITIDVPLFMVSIGVDFSITFKVNNEVSFPWYGNSINPVKLTVEIEPSAEVTASIAGYVSAYVIRGGVYGDGTLVRVGLPVTLSYQEDRSYGRKWCVNLYSRLTALELSAGIFYQWRNWFWGWGTRRTLLKFGTWSAINRNWRVLERCG